MHACTRTHTHACWWANTQAHIHKENNFILKLHKVRKFNKITRESTHLSTLPLEGSPVCVAISMSVAPVDVSAVSSLGLHCGWGCPGNPAAGRG